ncbi:quaternary ammonium compound efflux SMR transporter SugE [Aliihoeflea aestuarii]|jgi:quaternary ammonium compound-resistance protein SugE|uniref:quaternary ammonium compound efflux SMR transporter SugE n=1 Tax=Aliihoeflea aestuarii TaxID=453840 RepID=UPI002095BA78|nr:quaternary ammonium compound efflux SMR transporter SugE [Aliihoeflea aestuarii]MCO6393072.1 quaternary ammonium compound efflux SMR transporter SugE [Aliihoeflea aestuarii]
MAWIFLGIAGLFEVIWATSMKYSEGFTKLGPTAITVAAMVVSFAFLSFSLKALPLGTAYAIWTGIGAAGAFVVGVMFMGEAATLGRIVSILLLVSGIVGLKLSSGV